MKMIRAIALLFLGILILGGCRVGKNYTRPEVQLPEHYLFDEEKANFDDKLKWWNLFNDPELDTLIQKALHNNKDLLATAQRVEAVRHQLAIQKADLYPQFSYSGTAGRGNYAGSKLPNPVNSFNLIGQASWELDFWGKIRRMNEAAQAQYLASEHGLNALRLSLVTTVATTYFQVQEFNAKLQIAESTYAIRDSSYQILQYRLDAGIIPAIDLNHSRIQKAIAEAAIPLYKRLATQSENFLAFLIGEYPSQQDYANKLNVYAQVPEIPAGIPSSLLDRRPDIMQAEQELIAQTAMVGVAQALRLPSFSLTGLLGVASNDLSELTSGDPAWNVNGSLLGPLFNWQKNANRVKAEEALTQAAIHQYEGIVLHAFREVEDALVAIQTLKQEEKAIQEHVDAAVEAAKLSEERYDKGIASYIEFLESQRQAFDAQMSLTSNKQDLLEAFINLYQALGGGWE
ncbi:efflux transporter outer membrane subunit [Sunxiuqinia rutila]|uniref:efflux transporter outer membrane subunit n=1 Tax=Sunxiuqinia rutila TaxID=1397841 RepID=UPI003D36F3E3